MPQPATKRRKLSHSSEDASSDDGIGSISSEGEAPFPDNDTDTDTDTEGDIAPGEELNGDDEGAEEFVDREGSKEDQEANIPIRLSERANKRNPPDRNGHHAPQTRQNSAPQSETYNGEVYKSNTFKLQVDDLLGQVRLKHGKKEAAVEKALRSLKSIIERIPDREPLPIADAERQLVKMHKVVTPFPSPRPPKDANYKLQYAKPAHINAVGSYPLKIATRTGEELTIDLAVIMPSSIFQEKDYLNHRYFYKRAYYLACIAAGVSGSKEHAFKLSFHLLNGDQLQPILVVQPSGNGGDEDFSNSNYRIHIIPAIADGVFPHEKTTPERNCVRPKSSHENPAVPKPTPTPFYNSSLRADSSVTAYLKLLHTCASSCESYRDACMLGRIWLRQRGFGSQICKGGFGNFEWAALMALLLERNNPGGAPVLSPGYSSYQLFKATLQFLVSRNFIKQPYLFQARNIELLKGEDVPVFYDGPRGLNVLFKMTPWSYKIFRQEAHTTMAMLGESVFDYFDAAFILRADQTSYRFDGVLEIPVSALLSNVAEEDHEQQLRQQSRRLYSVFSRGLTDRVTCISIDQPEESRWQVGSNRIAYTRDARLVAGFVINSENAGREVDRGPSAEEKKEAAAFRNFWGEKAELRRFNDGSILESLVWSTKDAQRPIFEQIVFYILSRHIGKDVADRSIYVGDSFARLLTPGASSPQLGTKPFQLLSNAFVSFERDLRALEGLPLQIRHIFAADPQLRFASMEAPLSTSQKIMSEPANVVIQFEGSGRWPDDLVAIQHTKIAFLLKLGELLEEARKGVKCRVGLENEYRDLFNQSFLDVVYPSGATFRLRIHHDREQTLLERRLRDKSLDAHGREEPALALAAYKRDFLRETAYTQAIQNLGTRYPAFSPAVRLVKRWFASHLICSHVAPEFIELLVARTFLQPYPWQTPSSASTGFLRTLFFLSRWDWHNDPLLIDFSGSMKPAKYKAINTRLEAWRKIDPALNRVVVFAASNVDPDGTTWTDNARPAKVVAARMTALARAACQAVKEHGIHIDPAILFSSPLTDYDFVLHLHPRFTHAGRKKDKNPSKEQFKNLELQAASSNSTDLVGFNVAAMYFEELRDVYEHAAIFFHDMNGGDVIAGLWNPSTARRQWKVKLGYSSMPVAASPGEKSTTSVALGVDVDINKDAMLNEMARLGGELVQGVELNKH